MKHEKMIILIYKALIFALVVMVLFIGWVLLWVLNTQKNKNKKTEEVKKWKYHNFTTKINSSSKVKV